jgi:peptide/nickel transport system substrate-binding protein
VKEKKDVRRVYFVSLLSIVLMALVLTVYTAAFGQNQPKRGGTLVLAMSIEPASLDPIYSDSTTDPSIFNQLYDKLVYLDESGNLLPGLAESWTLSEDRKSVTLKLLEGITFHDGTLFNAEAVKFHFDRLMDPKMNSPVRGNVPELVSTEVIDEHAVRMNLRMPSAGFLAQLAERPSYIASPAAIKKWGDAFGRNPVGTGPFKFNEWITSDRIVVERYDHYWKMGVDGKPLPYLNRIVTRFFPISAGKLVELRTGGAHLSDAVDVKDYPQVEREPNLEFLKPPVSTHHYMCLNVTKPPFDNLDLRKAVSYAINREAIEKIISKGFGEVPYAIWTKSFWAYDPSVKGYSYDPVKAKEHYRKSGHSGPIEISVIQRSPDIEMAQIIQAQLKEVGIEVTVEILERQAWIQKVRSLKYECGTLRRESPRPDPAIDFNLNWIRQARANWSGIEDEALWELSEKAGMAMNKEERRRIYSEAFRRILDKAYYVFVFNRPNMDVKNKKVNGVMYEVAGTFRLEEACMD